MASLTTAIATETITSTHIALRTDFIIAIETEIVTEMLTPTATTETVTKWLTPATATISATTSATPSFHFVDAEYNSAVLMKTFEILGQSILVAIAFALTTAVLFMFANAVANIGTRILGPPVRPYESRNEQLWDACLLLAIFHMVFSSTFLICWMLEDGFVSLSPVWMCIFYSFGIVFSGATFIVAVAAIGQGIYKGLVKVGLMDVEAKKASESAAKPTTPSPSPSPSPSPVHEAVGIQDSELEELLVKDGYVRV